MSETQIVKACLDVFHMNGLLAWRQNQIGVPIGARRVGGEVVLKGWRRLGIKGIADIGAVAPTGRAVQCECKVPGERPRAEQAAWLNSVYRLGGIALVAYSFQEVALLCELARRIGWDKVPSPWHEGDGLSARPRR